MHLPDSVVGASTCQVLHATCQVLHADVITCLSPLHRNAAMTGRRLYMHEEFVNIMQAVNLCTVYGGSSYPPQETLCLGVHIVVRTPGRVKDYLNKLLVSASLKRSTLRTTTQKDEGRKKRYQPHITLHTNIPYATHERPNVCHRAG